MTAPIFRFLRLLWRALQRFSADHGVNHAAAVAYFSLLSLPPFFLLAGRALTLVLPATGGADGTDAILSAVAPFLPLEIAPALRTLGRSIHQGGALVAFADHPISKFAAPTTTQLPTASGPLFLNEPNCGPHFVQSHSGLLGGCGGR